MSYRAQTPFDSIESAHEYVALLAEAIKTSTAEVQADLAQAESGGADARRVHALQLVLFNMNKLERHMSSSGRILNDLRTLRRLLLEERTLPEESAEAEQRS